MGYTPIQYQLNLLSGSGTNGTLVASRTAVAQWGLDGFLYFDFTGTNLVVGDSYTAVFSQITPEPPPSTGSSVRGTTDVYSGGMAFFSDDASGGPAKAYPAKDFYLRVLDTDAISPVPDPSQTVSAVPEPGTLALLGLPAIGFGLLRFRRR